MPTTTHSPCSLVRPATLGRHAFVCVLAWSLLAGAPLSAVAAESALRLVGSPACEEPHQADETSRLVVLSGTDSMASYPPAKPASQVETTFERLRIDLAALMQMPDEDWSWDPIERLATRWKEPIAVALKNGAEEIAPAEPVAEGPSVTMAANLTANISLPPGKLPTDKGAQLAASRPERIDARMADMWSMTNHHWSATCLCHRPLYFEEVNLERYGYTPSYTFQPLISAGRFLVTIPALPYKMLVERPKQCIYTLGHYRPGSCAPRCVNRPPLKLGAGAFEASVLVGLVFLIP